MTSLDRLGAPPGSEPAEGDGSRRASARHGHRVAVTGLGPITAAGIGVQELWTGLKAARSPIRRVSRFDPMTWRSQIAAEVEGFEAERYMDRNVARRLDRYGQFALAAARLALDDAGLDPNRLDPDRVGVQIGSALGGIGHAEAQARNMAEKGIRAVDPRVALTTFAGAASCAIAIEHGFTGPNATNAMSCASGTIALGQGWRLIRDGEADVILTGGVEAPLAPLTFGAFAIIRAMSTRNREPERACRPFDRDRDGFVMGEGAAALVLERWDAAVARGARIYGEIAGYGTTNDAFHMTAPRPDGSQASRAIRLAVECAEIEARDIDLVLAHGSSTPLNDSTESQAIRRALGEGVDQVPVVGTKPYHGHALGASGAMEAVIGFLAMERGWVPPTLNLDTPGEECDLRYIRGEGLDLRPRLALSTSFGFGGINACLVFRSLDGGFGPA